MAKEGTVVSFQIVNNESKFWHVLLDVQKQKNESKCNHEI